MAKIVKQVWLVHDLSTNDEFVSSSMGPPYDDPDCYDLAGPVSVEFDVPDVARCPHCHKALPESEKPKLPLLPLVVGGVYGTRGGGRTTLGQHESPSHPFFGDNGFYYTSYGTLYPHKYAMGPQPQDLIERIA